MGRGGGGSGGSHGGGGGHFNYGSSEVVDTLAVVDAPARIIAQCTELLTTDQ